MFKFLTITLVSFLLMACAPDSDSSSKSKKAIEPPPISKPSEPVQPEPPKEPEFPTLADSNHPLGGWWVGEGSIYDSTGWVSKCDSIVLGMVVNASLAESPLAEKSEVSIEKFEYSKCAHGEPVKWGRVVIKISNDGSLVLNNQQIGVLSNSQFRFKLKARNGMEYSFELNYIGDNAEFMDLRFYEDKNLMIMTDGKLKRLIL